jgi:superfamily II DNA/RNA helicase
LLNDPNACEADIPAQPETTSTLPHTDMAAAEIAVVEVAHAEADAPAPALEAGPDAPAEAQAEAEVRITFADTGLSDNILSAITEKGYTTPPRSRPRPFPWCCRARRDRHRPDRHRQDRQLHPADDRHPQAAARGPHAARLVLEPTRELADQVAESFDKYGKYSKLSHALLIGGDSMDEQIRKLMTGRGRADRHPGPADGPFERGRLLLTQVNILVIDEADRMLDMGFIPDVEKICKLPALHPPDAVLLGDHAAGNRPADGCVPAESEDDQVSKSATVATTIVAGLALVAEHDKREALRRLIRSEDVQNALIFCNRKRDVDILYKS